MNLNIPKISIVIPSYDGYREGNVPKLLEDLKKQIFQDFEVILVKGVKPNGRARNEGVKRARGEILIFIDDDVRLGDEKVINNLRRILNENSDIGIAGCSKLLNLDANYFQRLCHREFPRDSLPVVERVMDTDKAAHDCLAIKKSLYEELGGEHDFLIRGTDPELRYKVRSAGYRVVIAPHTFIYHPHPKSLKELVKKSFRDGTGAAWVFKNYPELVFEVSEKDTGEFKPKRSFIYRYIRRIFNLIWSLFSFKFLRFISDFFYITGYIYGLIIKGERIQG